MSGLGMWEGDRLKLGGCERSLFRMLFGKAIV